MSWQGDDNNGRSVDPYGEGAGQQQPAPDFGFGGAAGRGRTVEEIFASMMEGQGGTASPNLASAGFPGYRKAPMVPEDDDMNLEREAVFFHRMFTSAVTLCCFAIYSYPLVSAMYLGGQRNVQFWAGRYGQWSLLVPFIFLGGYAVQVQFAAPRRVVVLVTALLPAVIFLLIGNSYHASSYHVADQLLSTDCTTFTKKRELDRAWFMAHAFYIDCLKRLSSHAGSAGQELHIEDAMKVYRIHHCEEYDEAYLQYEEEWSYLAYVEENHLCSGWCQIGPRLWSFRDAKDSCSVAVGDVFRGEVQRTSLQIIVIAILALVVCTVAILVGPSMLRRGGARV